MSENVYAPPQADLTGGPGGPAVGTGDFTIGRCFSEAWANTWANFPLWLGVAVVGLVAMAAAAVTIIGIVLAVPVLAWGFAVAFLRMHDGGAELADLFSGFKRYGTALAGMLGFILVTIGVGIVGQIPSFAAGAAESTVLAIVGFFFNLAVSLLVTPRLGFAVFLMVDRDMRLGAALQEAWSRTGPLMWKLAALQLVVIVVMLVGLLALIVGVIPASTVGYMMTISAYRQIFGGPPQARV